jgi:hypothetical protein
VATRVGLVGLLSSSCGGEPAELAPCRGCLCIDPTWSCDGGTVVDEGGHVLLLAPELGFFELEGGCFGDPPSCDETARLFYAFFPADEAPEDKPLFLMFNGGPGVPATAWLMAMNTAPFTLDPMRSNEAWAPNPHRWTRFANLLYVDPRRSGFSYSLGAGDLHEGRMTFSPERDADDVLRVLGRFLARHPQLGGAELVITGESYGGTRATLMVDRLLGPTHSFDVELSELATLVARAPAMVLVQPRLTDYQRDHEDALWPFPGCLPEAKGWTKCDDPIASADRCRSEVARRLLDPSTLASAAGVDLTTIEWLAPAARWGSTRAVDPFGCSPDSASLEDRLGQPAEGDAYYRMWVDYTNWNAFQADTTAAATFLTWLMEVEVMITDAALDARVWSPALVPALEEYGVSVMHDTQPRPGVARPGWLVVDGQELRFPHYPTSGHDVSAWQPEELADDVAAWLAR